MKIGLAGAVVGVVLAVIISPKAECG